jgi:hypothetical protein
MPTNFDLKIGIHFGNASNKSLSSCLPLWNSFASDLNMSIIQSIPFIINSPKSCPTHPNINSLLLKAF